MDSHEWKHGRARCIVYSPRVLGTDAAPHWRDYEYRIGGNTPEGAEILRLAEEREQWAGYIVWHPGDGSEPHKLVAIGEQVIDAYHERKAICSFIEGRYAPEDTVGDLVGRLRSIEHHETSHKDHASSENAPDSASAQEREAVVRYLRKQAQLYVSDSVCDALLEVSDEIMRGDHAVLQEAHGPSSNPPDSEASADSCERNGGTESPDTSG